MSIFYVPVRRSLYLTLGILNKFIPSKKSDVFILCYHSISDDGWDFSVSLKSFKKQMKYLQSQKYNFITLSDLESYIEGKKMITRPSVVITFDDGYKNILQTKDFLKSLNIKPALFVLSDTKNANHKELNNNLEFLNTSEIKSLINNGWEIGSHTKTHSNMNSLSSSQIEEEIINSKKEIENQLKTKINYLAYPKGKYNSKILKAVKKAGYKMALTMDDGNITKGVNPYLITRIGVDGTHSYSEFKTLFLPITIKIRGLIKSTGYGK